MAKPNSPTKEKYAYPSQFGSHASMIDQEATDKLADSAKVVLKDEFGTYITERSRIDSGLADPNRYTVKRVTGLAVEKNEEKSV